MSDYVHSNFSIAFLQCGQSIARCSISLYAIQRVAQDAQRIFEQSHPSGVRVASLCAHTMQRCTPTAGEAVPVVVGVTSGTGPSGVLSMVCTVWTECPGDGVNVETVEGVSNWWCAIRGGCPPRRNGVAKVPIFR